MKTMVMCLVCAAVLVCVVPFIYAGEKMKELQVVPSVDLQRYLGKWYEIARYPAPFEKNCVAVTAEYALRADGKISVINSCRKGTLDGPEKAAHGTAWVTDKTTNAKLRVRFFWPFSGAYWIIELGNNYEYAVVGHPKRKYLWILSRTPHMDDALYADILKKIAAHAYDLAPIEKTLQPQ